MAQRRFAPMDIIATTPTLARPTATTAQIGSWAACSSARDPGSTVSVAGSLADRDLEAGSEVDSDLVADLDLAAGLPRLVADLQPHAGGSHTVPLAAASMEAQAASTVVEVSMVVEDMAAAAGS